MNPRQKFLTALLASLVPFAGGVQSARALDTDIYLKPQSVTRADEPNVLIIFDNSGSMGTLVTSRPAYDPSIDYCADDLDTATGITGANDGKPSNCADIAGRVYRSFDSQPPGITSDKWFAASKNKCFDSASSLNSAGFYGGTKIARWQSGSNWGSLAFQDDTDITYVDCEADGSNDGETIGDGQAPRNNKQNAYTSSTNTNLVFVWANYTSGTSPTLYAANYMNYYHNSALATDRSRMDVAQEAVKSLVDGNKSVRFGMMTFNENDSGDIDHGGRVIFRIDAMTDTRRTDLKNVIDSLSPYGKTPLAESMWEGYRYFAGDTVYYGDDDAEATPARDTSAESNGTYISPLSYQCQKAYVIYVSDGDPTYDQHADADIESLIGTTCDGDSCLDDLAGWMNNHDVNSTLDGSQKVATYTIGFGDGLSIAGLTLLKETATQGGGRYYSAQDADQLSSALQGALAEVLEQNTSFTSPSLSVNAFNRLHNRDDVYFALFKPSNSCNWDGNVKKYRLCTNDDIDNGDCDNLSDILDQTPKEIIDANAKIIDSAWSYWTTSVSSPDGPEVTKGGAGEHVPDPSSRTLYTYYGDYATGLPASPVEVATTSNAFYDAVTADPTLLGLPSSSTTAEVDALVNWMRGQDSYDKDLDGSTTDKRWAFGDALHSRPVAVTYGAVVTADGPDYDQPIIKLFVGTNDGAVRMINDSTGAEEWAFIPQETYGIQYDLSQESETAHFYGLDTTPSFWVNDVDQDGIIDPSVGDKVYMYVAMRRGGRNIYAFDITPASTMTSQSDTLTPRLLWVIQGGAGDYTRLGQTWSRPLITRIRFKCSGSVCDDGNPDTDDSESRVALLFAGGYDTNQDNGIPAGTDSIGNAIYVVDPRTGQRIWWASSDTGATLVLPGMEYGIPSNLTLMDSDGDGNTDRLFVGDTGGQLWRIDLGDQMAVDANGGSAAYVFADVGCTGGTRDDDCAATSNQDRRKFLYPPDVAQVKDSTFSDNPKYDLVTIGSGDRADPLDLLTTNLLSGPEEAVHNRIYAFRDYNVATGPAPTDANGDLPAPLTEADLFDATTNTSPTATDLKSTEGWFIDLEAETAITVPNGLTTTWIGEKVLARTSIFNGQVFVTTYTPANDTNAVTTCSANEGVAKQYVLNAFTAEGEGDFDQDGTTERAAQIGGGIPSEVVIVFRPDGTSGLIGTSGGATAAIGDFSDPPQRTFWYEE